MSIPRHLGDKDKEYILDYMFGQMGIKAVLMRQQALLALNSYGVTTGLIGMNIVSIRPDTNYELLIRMHVMLISLC